MKRFFKTAILLFFSTLFCLSGFSCGTKGGEKEKTWLEGVFRGTPLVLAEREKPLASVLPYFDREQNRVLCMAGWEGTVTVYACTPDGEAAKAVRSDPISGEILCGAVSADGYILVSRTEDGNGSPVYSLIRAAGENVAVTDLDEVLPASLSRDFYGAAADESGNGNIVLLTREAVAVLAPDLSCRFIIDIQGGERFVPGRDGSVWVMTFEKVAYKLARIMTDSGEVADMVTLPDEVRSVWYGSDGDLYYETVSGIFCRRSGEDTPIFNYVNSGLSSTSARILAVWDDEHIFAIRHRADIEVDLLMLYQKAAEEELGKIVLEVAVPTKISNRYYEKIVLFNEAHDDIHVSVKDYSVYNTKEDGDAGNRRLSVDILTGVYSPDLIAGQYDNDTVINMCVEKKFYANLMPYLQTDSEVNVETLFPCLLRAYDDGDSGIWGLTDRFWLDFMVGERSMLKQYGEAGHWIVQEMLDFYENLPEGTELILSLIQTNAVQYLLGPEGCSAFIDWKNKTCSFEEKDFLRFLRLMKELPANGEDYRLRSPLADTPQTEQIRLYQEGKVILKRIRTSAPLYEYLQMKLYYPDGEAVPIGYPTSHESGNIVRAETSWVITSFGEHQDAAWELLSTIVRERNSDNVPRCSALMADFDRNASELYKMEFFLYYDGTSDGKLFDPEHPTMDSDLSSPGIVARYTEKDHETLKAWIADAGTPLISNVTEEVQRIIDEEISAYLGGVGSEEDCARKIQSRVSIWLAEHQ